MSSSSFIHRITLRSATAGSRPGTRPAVDSLARAGVTDGRPIVVPRHPPLEPGINGPQGATGQSSDRWSSLRRRRPGNDRIRRFADQFQPLTGKLPPPGARHIADYADLAPQAWHLRLVSTEGATVCGLDSAAERRQAPWDSIPTAALGRTSGARTACAELARRPLRARHVTKAEPLKGRHKLKSGAVARAGVGERAEHRRRRVRPHPVAGLVMLNGQPTP